MKYRIVGWTWFEDPDFDVKAENISLAEYRVIIDEIKKHGYLFTGWHHQTLDCAPVFNDGKKRLFSQRGWGDVMAHAHGHGNETYGYVKYAWKQSVDEEDLVMPDEEDLVTFDDFTPETDLNEVYEIEVNEELFNYAKSNNPLYISNLFRLRFIDKNDTLILKCGENTTKYVVEWVAISRTYNGVNCSSFIKNDYKLEITYKYEEEKN